MANKTVGFPNTSLHDLIFKSANTGVSLQDKTGAMPPGRNGPWDDPQTPVRNTAHWAIVFAWCYKTEGDHEYLQAANKCIEYLQSKKARPYGSIYHHREGDKKDQNNGLVGQAWTIEALAFCSDALSNETLRQIAIEVVEAHPYNTDRDLWHSIGINGEDQGIHGTINQQIWFAAAASLLSDYSNVKYKCEKFLNGLSGNLRTYSTGLVKHSGYKNKRYWERVKEVLRPHIKRERSFLSKGYHSFVLYGLSILKRKFPDHDFWSSSAIKKIHQYSNSALVKCQLYSNPFSYSYNPTGFEMAYFHEVFSKKGENRSQYWIEEQIHRTYNSDNGLMEKGSDPETLAARIYEAIRLPNYPIRTHID